MKNNNTPSIFDQSLGTWISIITMSMFLSLVTTWAFTELQDSEKRWKEYETEVKKWKDNCEKKGGKVVTYSYQQKRFNYRNRYETKYKTYCENNKNDLNP